VCCCGPDPFPDTLYLTDSIYGSCTLTYSATVGY
jgi:hypothetical protein